MDGRSNMDAAFYRSESQEAKQQRQESTRTLVQSLTQEGRIEEAVEVALEAVRIDRGNGIPTTTLRYELWAIIFPVPLEPTSCSNGHPIKWIPKLFTTNGVRWCEDTCKQCEEKRAEFERRPYRHRPAEELHSAMIEVGVPTRFLTATVKQLESTTASLYLTGPRGTGKTHMAAAIIREIVMDKTPSHNLSGFEWISAPDLLLEIRATFRNGAERSEKEIIEQYSYCRLLVLDDLGAEKTSEWSLQTLYTIIDRRYREERQTIITSNLSLDELAAKVDDRIASRLSELCRVVVLTGPDRRATRKKKE